MADNKILLSVSGYNYTGASAVVDLLREYPGVSVVKSELSFVYLPDGLVDLDYHVNNAPTYFNGDVAVQRYWNLCRKSWFPKEYKREFLNITKEYLDKLIELTWKGKSCFDGTRMSGLRYYFWNCKQLFSSGFYHFFRKALPTNERTVYLAHRCSTFNHLTDEYLNQVLNLVTPDCSIAAFNQFFSAFQPDQTMRFMHNAKTIVVDRDPRDVYILGHMRHETGVFPSFDAKSFVVWYRRCWDNRQKNNSDKTLILNFEDLVLKYDETVQQIERFLGVSEHVNEKKYFNPDVSIKNMQLKWRFPELSEDIAYIEENLSDYLYPFTSKLEPLGDFF